MLAVLRGKRCNGNEDVTESKLLLFIKCRSCVAELDNAVVRVVIPSVCLAVAVH